MSLVGKVMENQTNQIDDLREFSSKEISLWFSLNLPLSTYVGKRPLAHPRDADRHRSNFGAKFIWRSECADSLQEVDRPSFLGLRSDVGGKLDYGVAPFELPCARPTLRVAHAVEFARQFFPPHAVHRLKPVMPRHFQAERQPEGKPFARVGRVSRRAGFACYDAPPRQSGK